MKRGPNQKSNLKKNDQSKSNIETMRVSKKQSTEIVSDYILCNAMQCYQNIIWFYETPQSATDIGRWDIQLVVASALFEEKIFEKTLDAFSTSEEVANRHKRVRMYLNKFYG